MASELFRKIGEKEVYVVRDNEGRIVVSDELFNALIDNFEKQREEIAKLCHTNIEDVKVISKTEYDENTEEDEKDYDSDWLL